MTRAIGSALIALGLGASLIALPAIAQTTQPLSATPLPMDTITITAMAAVPNVGAGAPLFSADELNRMYAAERREMNRLNTSIMRCKIKLQNPLPGEAPNLAIFQKEPTAIDAPRSLNTVFTLVQDEAEQHRFYAAALGKARTATEKAEKARADAARGLADAKVLETTELERQAAVNRMEQARIRLFEYSSRVSDYQYAASVGDVPDDAYLDARAGQREKTGFKFALAPEDMPNLKLQLDQAAMAATTSGEMIVVTGKIDNVGRATMDAPRIAVAALDSKGFELTRVIAASKGRIAAGGAKTFAYGLSDPPGATASLKVYFVSDLLPPPRLPMAMFDGCLGN